MPGVLFAYRDDFRFCTTPDSSETYLCQVALTVPETCATDGTIAAACN